MSNQSNNEGGIIYSFICAVLFSAFGAFVFAVIGSAT